MAAIEIESPVATADAARPDTIVLGDADVLVLVSHPGAPIVTPAQPHVLIGVAD